MTCAFCKDQCYWRITYNGGEVITECCDDAQDHRSFSTVDKTRVHYMEWLGVDDHTSRLRVELVGNDREPVLLRRRFITLDVTGREAAPRTTVHILGIANEQYLFLLPDNTVFASSDLNAI